MKQRILVVFVYVPQDVRLERLKKREAERYGDSRYEETRDFLEWAAAYDAGTRNGRSLPRHEAWLENVECPVLRIGNDFLEDSVKAVMNAL